LSIIGAAPFQTISGQRFIFLFLITLDKGIKKLAYTRYDLEGRNWDTETQDLDLPDNATNFVAVLKQRNREDAAPELALQLHAVGKPESDHLRGIIYSRQLNAGGADWDGDDWTPIATAALGAQ
jgi:hypothetical protein